jgi:predicted Zn-dependent peptidase
MDWDAKLEASVKGLTAEQVNAALRRYLDGSNISVFKAGDFAKGKKKLDNPAPGPVR